MYAPTDPRSWGGGAIIYEAGQIFGELRIYDPATGRYGFLSYSRVANALALGTQDAQNVEMMTDGTRRWVFNISGDLVTLGAYSIGNGAGLSPHKIYVEDSIDSPVYKVAGAAGASGSGTNVTTVSGITTVIT